MTDREMLELAAKAGGVPILGPVFGMDVDSPLQCFSLLGRKYWNPLTDDGDALRLAVAVGLIVCVMPEAGFTGVYLPTHVGGKFDVVEHHAGDPYAATRRAIVRAAAEIQRTKENNDADR